MRKPSRHLFTHTITHKRESVTSGSAAGPIRNYDTVVATGVKCRIVPTVLKPSEMKEGVRITHMVYFRDDPGADERSLFVFGTRNLLVHTVKNPDELDSHWRAECEERTDIDNG